MVVRAGPAMGLLPVVSNGGEVPDELRVVSAG
jgi:hypothetical protein